VPVIGLAGKGLGAHDQVCFKVAAIPTFTPNSYGVLVMANLQKLPEIVSGKVENCGKLYTRNRKILN